MSSDQLVELYCRRVEVVVAVYTKMAGNSYIGNSYIS